MEFAVGARADPCASAGTRCGCRPLAVQQDGYINSAVATPDLFGDLAAAFGCRYHPRVAGWLARGGQGCFETLLRVVAAALAAINALKNRRQNTKCLIDLEQPYNSRSLGSRGYKGVEGPINHFCMSLRRDSVGGRHPFSRGTRR